MAATNFTPIQLYHSTTASAAPTAGNLANGELAINITDGKLFYKDNGGTVQVLATKGTGTIGGSNNQVQYNSSGALAGSANFTFDGTTATINTLNLTTVLDETYGGTGNTSYATGDLLYASAANTLSKLTVGTNGYILTSNGTIPTWTAGSSISVNTATNLAGGLAGSVPYQSGPGATTFLGIGAANRVLTSSGTAPQWVTSLTGLTGVSSSGLTNTSLTAGRVVYSTTGGAQTDSANLTFDGTTLTSAGLASSGVSTLDKLVKIGDSGFTLPAVLSATAPAKLYVSTATVTDGSSANGATNVLGTIVSLGSTTVAASNTGVTYTNLATLYIAGAPTAGTNVTITNPYALYIAGGASYFGGAVTYGGNLTVTGNLQVDGNTTLGNASADTVTVNGTITSNLIFTDNTYDIGASGATRPRNLYLSNNGVIGSTLAVGKSSASQVVDASASDTTAYAASSSSLFQPAGGANISIANTGTGGYASLRFTSLDSSNAVGYLGFVNVGGSVSGNFVIGQRTNTTAYAEQLRLMPNSVIQMSDPAGSYSTYNKDATSPGFAVKASTFGALGGPVCGDWSVNAYPTGTPDPAYAVWKGISTGAYAYLSEINGNYGFQWLVSNNTVTAGSAVTWSTGMVLDNKLQLGVGLYPKTWYANRRAIEVGGKAVATLALTPTISEIMTNLYYDAAGSSLNYGGGYSSSVEFNNNVTGGWTWRQGYQATGGGTVTLATLMNLDAGGNLNLGVGNTTAASRLNVYTSSNPVVYSATYGASATFQAGTGNFALTGSNPRGIGVLINSNQNSNITLPYGGSYENIGLVSAAQFVAGGSYTTYAIGAYARSDGSAWAIRTDAVTTNTGASTIGLYIGSSSGSTNQNYGIYQYDINNVNYFAGPIAIGTSQNSNTTATVFFRVGTGSGSQQNWAWIAGNATAIPSGATYGLLMGTNLSQGNSEANIVYGTGIGSGQGLTIGAWTGSVYAERARFDYYGNFLVGINARTNGVSSSFGAALECHAYAGYANMLGSTWVTLLTLTYSSFTCADIIIQGAENGNVNTTFAKYTVTWAGGSTSAWALAGPHEEVTSGNGYGQCNMRVNGQTLEVQARNGVSTGQIRYHIRYYSA